MSAPVLALFLAIVAVATYVQTVTGFALGLLIMGGVGLTGALSLPDAAVVVGILTLVNAGGVLARGWRSVWTAELRLILASDLPTLLVGYGLLELLAAHNLDGVRLVLGVAIVLSSLSLLGRAGLRTTRSSSRSFVLFGIAGGLMGGLFSTAGPPLVYHMYRQPFPAARIRDTLVAVFAINATVRLGLVTMAGHLPIAALPSAALAVPVVAGVTYAARRWPPALSPHATRRIVFALLLASGASLAVPALVALLGHG